MERKSTRDGGNQAVEIVQTDEEVEEARKKKEAEEKANSEAAGEEVTPKPKRNR